MFDMPALRTSGAPADWGKTFGIKHYYVISLELVQKIY